MLLKTEYTQAIHKLTSHIQSKNFNYCGHENLQRRSWLRKGCLFVYLHQ